MKGKLVVRKAKIDQSARRRAMLQQGKVDVKDFPAGNRAERRLAKSKKAKKAMEGPL